MFNSSIPKDPVILLSWVNTKLRDSYSSLDALCDDFNIRPEDIKTPLAAIGYTYDTQHNRFV